MYVCVSVCKRHAMKQAQPCAVVRDSVGGVHFLQHLRFTASGLKLIQSCSEPTGKRLQRISNTKPE